MTSPEYQAPTWVNEDDPDFIEGVSPDLGAGYLNQLSGAVEDHGQRLGGVESDVTTLQNTALDQAAGDNRYILQSNANAFAPADATTTALAALPFRADNVTTTGAAAGNLVAVTHVTGGNADGFGLLGTQEITPDLIGASPKLTPTAVKTANYTATVGDLVVCDATSAAFTVTLPTAAPGVAVAVRKADSTANTVTITAAGADTIGTVNPTASITLPVAGNVVLIGVTGGWVPLSLGSSVATLDTRYGRSPDVQVFTASGTWTRPASASRVQVTVLGGGGGGGSGPRLASGTASSGGAGGGGGGWATGTFRAADLGSTETITVGTGGTGGAAITTDGAAGAAGAAGGTSVFGTTSKVRASSASSGGAGGGTSTATGGSSGSSMLGGGAGANASVGATGTAAGTVNTQAAGGGGSGGGLSATPAAFGGGGGGTTTQTLVTAATGGATGGGAGGAGGAVAANLPLGGGGGAGGGSSTTGAGGAGGAGGIYGAGGGGGGASLNGFNSGAGGAGAPGIVIVISD